MKLVLISDNGNVEMIERPYDRHFDERATPGAHILVRGGKAVYDLVDGYRTSFGDTICLIYRQKPARYID